MLRISLPVLDPHLARVCTWQAEDAVPVRPREGGGHAAVHEHLGRLDILQIKTQATMSMVCLHICVSFHFNFLPEE